MFSHKANSLLRNHTNGIIFTFKDFNFNFIEKSEKRLMAYYKMTVDKMDRMDKFTTQVTK